MELIDKSKVVAELERLIFVCDSVISDYDHREYRKMYEERRKAYVNVRNFLDTLEVKEVNFTNAFIDKACEWIKKKWDDNYTMPIIINSVIEDFKNYMKGE